MLWARLDPSRLVEETQAVYQKIMSPRSLEDSEGDIEKRGSFDACPIRVDSNHPLY